MTASVDLLQILNDDTNLTPFYHAAAADARRAGVTRRATCSSGASDAGIEVLARVFAAAPDAQGSETCSAEIDPNAIAATLGPRAPRAADDGRRGQPRGRPSRRSSTWRRT